MKKFNIIVPVLLAVLAVASCCGHSKEKVADNKVKNVIIMIGDGMGLPQVGAFMLENRYAPTSFDRAQSVAICKTYSNNNWITDSGAAATAIATGHKTDNAKIGMTPDGEKVPTIMEIAKAKGMSTGLIVTSYLTDATPAGFAAHTSHRKNFDDIASQIKQLSPDILAGGGLDYLGSYFTRYAATPDAFYAVDTLPAIGIFAPKNMKPAPERGDYLSKASQHAVKLLEGNDKGFFVMIEGSQIDYACHNNDPETTIAEMRDFDKAVNLMFDYADSNPGTLVVVLADHETGGLSIVSNNTDYTSSESGVQYKFGTSSHSASPVMAYAYGTGACNIKGVIENTDIFGILKSMITAN